MVKILVAPNAFKGSLSAMDAADAIYRGIERSGLPAEIDRMPIADGGDDTLDVLVADGGRVMEVEVSDHLGRPVKAAFGVINNGRTAVVEMARAAGLKLLPSGERNPLLTSTFGVGQLIARAARSGVKEIIIGVGGSATVDGGGGCLQALGVKLLDTLGLDLPPGGGSLGLLADIDLDGLDPALEAVELLVACDVNNPVIGPRGAAVVFGPQKGATPDDVELLEQNLAHFFITAAQKTGRDMRPEPRGGAAGGLAAGLAAFLGAELAGGADLILDRLGIDDRLEGADLVITGEGRLDSQTLEGKGPFGVLKAAQKGGVPVIALAGSLGPGETDLIAAGFAAVIPIVPKHMDETEAMARAAELLEKAAERLGRDLFTGGHR